MQRFTQLAIVLALLSSQTVIAQTLKGTNWEAVVGNPPSTIELRFSAIDTMSITPAGGTLNAIANYALAGDTVTITDFNPASTGCPSPGVYQYNIFNNILTMTVISDNCATRADFVTAGGGAWTRAGIGIKDYGNANLVNIFPVPAEDILNVEVFEATSLEYSIIDLTGRTVLSGQINRQSNQIEVDQLPKGMYFFQIAEWSLSIRFNKI